MFSFGKEASSREEDSQGRRKGLADRSSSHCGDENAMPPTPRGLGTSSSSGKASLQTQAFLQVRELRQSLAGTLSMGRLLLLLVVVLSSCCAAPSVPAAVAPNERYGGSIR